MVAFHKHLRYVGEVFAAGLGGRAALGWIIFPEYELNLLLGRNLENW